MQSIESQRPSTTSDASTACHRRADRMKLCGFAPTMHEQKCSLCKSSLCPWRATSSTSSSKGESLVKLACTQHLLHLLLQGYWHVHPHLHMLPLVQSPSLRQGAQEQVKQSALSATAATLEQRSGLRTQQCLLSSLLHQLSDCPGENLMEGDSANVHCTAT